MYCHSEKKFDLFLFNRGIVQFKKYKIVGSLENSTRFSFVVNIQYIRIILIIYIPSTYIII